MAGSLDLRTDDGSSLTAGPVRAASRLPAVVLLRLVATLATLAIVLAAAWVMWLAPWPVDAVIAVAAAGAWTSWIERQEQE
jgi:hypothetical protein